jgi:hypothetical protein
MRLNPQEIREVTRDKKATKAMAPLPVLGIPATFWISQ